MATISLKAPLSGILMPIEEVPDPVFAEKMVGDGIALDPTTQKLLAPIGGEIVQLQEEWHALTLLTEEGVQILIHIGVDTVKLKSEGFLPHVKKGDKVKTGDVLIEFDADYIATHAPSLLTMIVIANGDNVEAIQKSSGSVTAGQDIILEITPKAVPAAEIATAVSSTAALSDPIFIPNHEGLHARPAAVLANMARKYKADIQLLKGAQQANAKSIVGIMGLNIGHQDSVQLAADGVDAEDAITGLTPLIREGLGQAGYPPIAAPASIAFAAAVAPPPRQHAADPNVFWGVTASGGVAVGKVFQARRGEIIVDPLSANPPVERRKLDDAIAQSKIELEALQMRLRAEADTEKAAIFAAHEEILDDPNLLALTYSGVESGQSSAYAWRQAINSQAAMLAQLPNELLAARANDLRDVGRRVLEKLTSIEAARLEAPPDSILIAEDLTPSDTANLDRSNVLGFATTLGGATSHVAILARAFGIPAVAGVEARALDIPNGAPVILDGTNGRLSIHPSPQEIAAVQAQHAQHAVQRDADLEAAFEAAVTTDNHQIEVVANISGLEDAKEAMLLGGEGVGLLRSEFLFLDRTTPPSEDEQTAAYSAVAQAMWPNRPLIIRTLDGGGDKPLPYAPIPPEANPFLGERGIRVGLNRPEILRTQLRAILRAAQSARISVMFPMIATMEEWRMARAMLAEEQINLGLAPIPTGIMVEIPATAIMAEQFAREADFFSIGANDLTQYTLAMDRGHPKLASQVDGLNPGVLQLISLTVQGAVKHGKWVGVCGGLAADPQAVPILLGLGVTELSVSVPAIPAVKAQIRRLNLAACQNLAAQALSQETAAAVRALTTIK